MTAITTATIAPITRGDQNPALLVTGVGVYPWGVGYEYGVGVGDVGVVVDVGGV